jgi:hypothetical protein
MKRRKKTESEKVHLSITDAKVRQQQILMEQSQSHILSITQEDETDDL